MKKLFLSLVALASFSCTNSNKKWPFDQAANVAVITQKQIIFDHAPILMVTHDAEDHGWQFLNLTIPVTVASSSVVGLGEIVKLDPSLMEIADLPVGWRAKREKIGAKWVREKNSK